MKQIIRFAVCIVLCLVLLTANLCAVSSASGFYSKVDMLQIAANMEKDVGLGTGSPIQGACVDGRYAYFAFLNGGVCHLAKYDTQTWKYVKKNKIVNMGHSNDMAYNSDKDYLVVANNAPYYNVVTLINPDTLEPIKDVKLKVQIYSIAYNAKRKNYVVGLSGGYDFALLDSDFKVLKKFTGKNTGSLRQGCDCDEDYIYFVQSGGNNRLVVYNYSGSYIADIPMSSTKEVENIFHIGNNYYTSLYYHGNYLHRIGFTDKTKISYQVTYDANGGEGEMTPTTVTYGKKTKLSPCTFTRQGYLFVGWRVQRTSDKKYVGYRNGAEKYEWLDEDDVYHDYLYEDKRAVETTVKFGGVKLYAVWAAEEYGIAIDCGDGSGEPIDATVGYEEAYTLPDGGFTKEGYIFDGYTASRDADNRVYGYRKKSEDPEWLEKSDVDRMYRFYDGESVQKLTLEGTVRMTAQYQYAYTFSQDNTELFRYVGVDEKVRVPDNNGKLTTMCEGAFTDITTMTELYIPSCVDTLEEKTITDCPNLRRIFFRDSVPKTIDGSFMVSDRAAVVYEIRDGYACFIGFYGGPQTVQLLRTQADMLEQISYLHPAENTAG